MENVRKSLVSYRLLSTMAMCAMLLPLSTAVLAVELPATTQWHQRIEINALRSGVVDKVAVAVGDRVKRGELLLQLEHELERSQRLLASKRLEQQQLLHKEAQREFERVEDLYERTLISEHDRAIGEAVWVGAATELQSAERELAQAKRDIRYSQISAPFNAIVIGRTAENGSIVNHLLQQLPLLTIASASSIAVDGYLSHKQLAGIAKGKTVQIRMAGKTVKGRVESIAQEPRVGSEGQYRLRILIPYNKRLRAGMSATILLD